MSKLEVTTLDRTELLELQAEIKVQLKSFRPYRIKSRVVQCGKLDCWCYEGTDGHGPYLFATYRDEGKTKTMSLGPELTIQEMISAVPELPNIFDYLIVPHHKYMDLSAGKVEGWTYGKLTAAQFLKRYGVSVEDDNFDRPRKFWGPREEYQRYQSDFDLILEEREIPYSKWAEYGVSTLEGMAKLAVLEGKGYYMK